MTPPASIIEDGMDSGYLSIAGIPVVAVGAPKPDGGQWTRMDLVALCDAINDAIGKEFEEGVNGRMA